MIVIEHCTDLDYLSALFRCDRSRLCNPKFRFYEAKEGETRRGAFLVVILPEGPELHLKLKLAGKSAMDAIKKVCSRIGADLGASRIFAYLPIYNARVRMLAVAAGAKRIGCDGQYAFYVKEL